MSGQPSPMPCWKYLSPDAEMRRQKFSYCRHALFVSISSIRSKSFSTPFLLRVENSSPDTLLLISFLTMLHMLGDPFPTLLCVYISSLAASRDP
uniref:Uncharacterized protein n=1 Tax=Cucumis sativus TaxID=3659 RepID=A0A0A0K937_CUCSA